MEHNKTKPDSNKPFVNFNSIILFIRIVLICTFAQNHLTYRPLKILQIESTVSPLQIKLDVMLSHTPHNYYVMQRGKLFNYCERITEKAFWKLLYKIWCRKSGSEHFFRLSSSLWIFGRSFDTPWDRRGAAQLCSGSRRLIEQTAPL